MLVDLDVMEVRPKASVGWHVSCILWLDHWCCRRRARTATAWLNQWFIAGTPMTARAHAAQYGLRLLPQRVGWVQNDREIKW